MPSKTKSSFELRADDRVSHYRVVEQIGRGAMGEVFRAVDERLGREVALKFLRKGLAGTEQQARLLREAQAASKLDHPGIVTIHDVGAWRGRVYVVMERVDGESFGKLAARGVAPDEALRLCAAAADALAAAHARGILHRDVKSENLMRTRDGRVKVLDFGLAKLREAHSEEGSGEKSLARILSSHEPHDTAGESTPYMVHDALAATMSPIAGPAEPDETEPFLGSPGADAFKLLGLVGTPAYMAPEQAAGAHVDATAEVFSLGVVLHELLMGVRPFDRDTVAETLAAVREGEVVPPSRAAPERKIPAGIEAVLMRALAKDRERRFPDMQAFALAARAALETTPRHRPLARPLVLAAIGAGGLAAGAALWAVLHMQDPAAATPAVARAPAAASIPSASPIQPSAIRRLTFDPGCEERPSLTPDGLTVLYDGVVDNDYELMARPLDGGPARRLSHSPSWDYGAVASPDGKRIAWMHLSEETEELRVGPIEGDEVTPPLRLGPAGGYPAWRDARTIVAGGAPGEILEWRLDEAAPLGRAVAHIAGGRLAHITLPVRDGYFVLWVDPLLSTLRRVGLVHVQGDTITPLDVPHPYGGDEGLAVVDGGRALFYVRPSTMLGVELARVPLAGARADAAGTRVVGNVSPLAGFAMTPDGRRLVYSTCRAADTLVRLSKNGVRAPWAPGGAWRDRNPRRLSGGRVLFTSDRSGSEQLWIAAAGGEARAVTGPETFQGAPSVDGRRAAFIDRKAHGVSVVDLGTGEVTSVTHDDGADAAELTPDGTGVVIHRTNDQGGEIVLVPLAGSHVPRLLVGPAGSMTVSPVDDRIVFLRAGTGRTELFLTTLAGDPPRRIGTDLPPAMYEVPRFSPDGKHLLLVRNRTEVWEIATDGRDFVRRFESKIEGIDSLDYAPEGDGLVVSVTGWEGDLWVAEGQFF